MLCLVCVLCVHCGFHPYFKKQGNAQPLPKFFGPSHKHIVPLKIAHSLLFTVNLWYAVIKFINYRYRANVGINSCLEESNIIPSSIPFLVESNGYVNTLVLLLFLSFISFAGERGFLPGVSGGGGGGDNCCRPRASAIIVFTVPFIDYLSLTGLVKHDWQEITIRPLASATSSSSHVWQRAAEQFFLSWLANCVWVRHTTVMFFYYSTAKPDQW